MTAVAQRGGVTPGTKIGRRYLLTERYPAPADRLGKHSSWWARDEVLSRPVWLRLLPSTGPIPAAVLEAARATAGLADPRFPRILDVGSSAGLRYLVTEAVAAPTLSDLLADGPLFPHDALAVVLQVADAMAAAHALGLAHGLLRADEVLLSDGSIKIVGLESSSALELPACRAGTDFAVRAAADIRACGALLYAALTGYWPGSADVQLPAAPRCTGRPYRPGQIKAGIPPCLDRVTSVLLGLPQRGRPVPRPPSCTELGRILRSLDEQMSRESRRSADLWALIPLRRRRRTVPAPAAPGRRPLPVPGKVAGVAGAAGAGLLLTGMLVAGGEIGRILLGSPPPRLPAPAARSRSSPAAQPVLPVRLVQVVGGGEIYSGGEPALAADGDPATAWRSAVATSRSATGPSRTPVGLLVDLGAPHTVTSVTLVLLGRPSDVQLRAGLRPPLDPAVYPLVRRVENVGPRITLVPDAPLSARYLLVQLTKTPAVTESPGLFRGGISDIAVRG